MNEIGRYPKKETGLTHTMVEHSAKCSTIITATFTNGEVLKKIGRDIKNK
jgi:hypothetical protein